MISMKQRMHQRRQYQSLHYRSLLIHSYYIWNLRLQVKQTVMMRSVKYQWKKLTRMMDPLGWLTITQLHCFILLNQIDTGDGSIEFMDYNDFFKCANDSLWSTESTIMIRLRLRFGL